MLLAELQANIQSSLSRSTIQRRLKENNIQKLLAKGRTRLRDEHKKAQCKWACEHYLGQRKTVKRFFRVMNA
jgi:hypothetical protein